MIDESLAVYAIKETQKMIGRNKIAANLNIEKKMKQLQLLTVEKLMKIKKKKKTKKKKLNMVLT